MANQTWLRLMQAMYFARASSAVLYRMAGTREVTSRVDALGHLGRPPA